MIYEQTILWPQAFIFSAHSCSSLSHSTQQSCLGRHSFTELRQIFLQLGVWFGQRCVFKWNLDTVCCKHQTLCQGKYACVTTVGKKKKIQHINLTEFRHCIQCHNILLGCSYCKVSWFNWQCADLSDCVTGSEDKRHRRKSSSHLSKARKRGRTVLYQLTSQFSRRGKREVNLGGVSTFTTLFFKGFLACAFLFTL